MRRHDLFRRLLIAIVLLVGAAWRVWVTPAQVDATALRPASEATRGLGPAMTGADLPRLLSETGLYTGDGTLTVDARNRPFSPQYPLWSDGAAKRRWVRLPEGATIDVTNVDAWDFPVGTQFWKEFAFNGRRVETRYLVKVGPERWLVASYVWNDAQTDAERAPDEGVAGVAEVAPGRFHSIPSTTECLACHESSRIEILGFTALQLSTDRDPNALHAEPMTPDMLTLRTLVAERRLAPGRPELVSAPPRIDADDPRTRTMLGYLSTNCGSCHNRSGSLASLGLSLKYTLSQGDTCAPDAIATTIGRPGHWVVPNTPPGASLLIRPGRPDHSALVARMRSRRPSSQMPAIGTVVADRSAVDLLTVWVAENAPAWEQRLAACAGGGPVQGPRDEGQRTKDTRPNESRMKG